MADLAPPTPTAARPISGGRLRHLLLALLLLAGPLAAEPPPPGLRPDVVRFIVANSEFTLLHEMGHMLISELNLPVLGREEDAADQLGLMILFLLRDDETDAEFDAKLLAIIDYWRLESQRPRPPAEQVRAWDAHGLDEQRFYNIACLVYGSDPERLEWVPRVTGLPVERALYCDQEYQQARKALDWIRHNHRRAAIQRRPRIRINYEPLPSYLPDGELLVEQLRRGGLEELARQVSHVFSPPRTLTLWIAPCGSPDAWYNRDEAMLTLCYERLHHFRELAETLPPRRHPGPGLECTASARKAWDGLSQPGC
ncbi:putative metallopeptidase [compost metagenome]